MKDLRTASDTERAERARLEVVPLALILSLGLAAGLTLVWMGPPARVVNDTEQYVALAASLVERGEYAILPGEPTAWRSPGYPFFLAIFALLGLIDVKIVCSVQVILHVLTAALTYGLARQLGFSAIALPAAALVALWPPLLAMSNHLLTETPSAFLVVATLYAILRALASAAPWRWVVLAGAAWGLGILVRPSLLFVPLPLAALLLPRGIVSRRLRTAFVALSIGLALQTPWVVRNALVFDAFIPTNLNSGISLFRGFYVPWDGINRGWKAEPLASLTEGLQFRRSADGLALNRIGREEAIKSMVDDPGAAVWLFIRKIFRLWDPTPNNVRQVFGSYLLYYVLRSAHLVALALAGIAVALGSGHRAPHLALFAILVTWSLFHALFEAQPRYAIPALPLVLMLAAEGGRVLTAHVRFAPRSPSRPA